MLCQYHISASEFWSKIILFDVIFQMCGRRHWQGLHTYNGLGEVCPELGILQVGQCNILQLTIIWNRMRWAVRKLSGLATTNTVLIFFMEITL